MMKKTAFFASAAVASCLFASSALASTTLTYTSGDSNDPFDTLPHTSVYVKLDGTNYNAEAGGFSMTDSTYNYILWCLDITGHVQDGAEYDVVNVSVSNPFTVNDGKDINPTLRGKLEEFFQYNYSTSFSAEQAAAFQLSLWELVFDDGIKDWTSGRVQQVGTLSASIYAIADGFFANLISGTKDTTLTSFKYFDDKPGESQDLIAAASESGFTPAVPLPAAGWLLGGGLVSLLGFGRLKKSRKATA